MGLNHSLIEKFRSEMIGYDFIVGKTYTILDGDMNTIVWVNDGIKGQAVMRGLIPHFFKPLNDIRNDKIDTILS